MPRGPTKRRWREDKLDTRGQSPSPDLFDIQRRNTGLFVNVQGLNVGFLDLYGGIIERLVENLNLIGVKQ